MLISNSNQIRIEFDQRVPMRDGITLSADIYRPIDASSASRKYPVILTRTPYMRLSERMLVPAKYFAERGYVFVAMDVYEVVAIPKVHLCPISMRGRMVTTPLNGALLSHGRMEMLAP